MKLIVRRPDTGYLDSALWVPKAYINVEGARRALTFQNADAKRVSFFVLYKETEHHLIVPRELWSPSDFEFPIIDCRPQQYPAVAIRSRILLDHRFENGTAVPTGDRIQQDAMHALLQSRGGILQLACGRGKTVVALDFIARRGVPAIIILDTTQLMRQWREEIEQHLELPDGVGLIQGSTFDWKKPVVLATYHSLAARADTLPEEVRRWFGTVVWDEAHHVAAPTFSKSADLFYGMRLGLTATPDREDGMHVVYNLHLGPVLYKNLVQDLRPRVYFVWTGLGLDKDDPKVLAAVNDKNGELHINKVAGFLGHWRPRIDAVIEQVRQATEQGRKVIVLSKSVDSLVNMLAAWNNQTALLADIPFPTAADVGEVEEPLELNEQRQQQLLKRLHAANGNLRKNPKSAADLHTKAAAELSLKKYKVYKKCLALWNKKRADYLKDLLARPSTAGLMIYKVDPETRSRLLREKQVTFAISKYGREGLNERSLDTIIVNEPLSSRNSLQQLMGRVLRKKEGKKEPVVVFLEDDIGPFIGMCRKLRQHLTTWPADEGGPFTYENIGHPSGMYRRASQTGGTYRSRPLRS